VVVSDKSVRVANFHKETLKALAELLAASGLTHPGELGPHHFMQRAAPDRVVTYAEIYPFLNEGQILDGTAGSAFMDAWDMASAESFDAAIPAGRSAAIAAAE
jgi:hypothetical protein